MAKKPKYPCCNYPGCLVGAGGLFCKTHSNFLPFETKQYVRKLWKKLPPETPFCRRPLNDLFVFSRAIETVLESQLRQLKTVSGANQNLREVRAKNRRRRDSWQAELPAEQKP